MHLSWWENDEKNEEKNVLVGKEEFIAAIRKRFRKKKGRMKRKDKEWEYEDKENGKRWMTKSWKW